MIFRFCLYGFLKNQRYFEPFLVLVLMEKGLSFFAIGLLLGWRDLAVNLMEIPSGALADGWGRRRSMILSFIAYIASFLLFGVARGAAPLVGAVTLYAVGDAFRTGTHKAMIFTWLRLQGRESERTQVYGLTRSWSKVGSAVSSLIAAAFVLLGGSMAWVFYGAVLPYALGVVNFLGYPEALEGEGRGQVRGRLTEVARLTLRSPELRGLIGESMGFEGVFEAVKEYLQPLLAVLAIALLAGMGVSALSDAQRAALLVGPVYFGLFLGSAAASRQAHRFEAWMGSPERGAAALWWGAIALYAVILLSLLGGLPALAVLGFALLYVGQNLWRPALIGRMDLHTPPEHGAAVLSVESQARSLISAVLAPLLGLAVDAAGGADGGLWPVAAVGLAVSVGFTLRRRRVPQS
ncbi:MAG: MFS transporter [Deltaproteobacteria bacterium]|nr:MFS transporter [Deltaproteobacteria bacterium]